MGSTFCMSKQKHSCNQCTCSLKQQYNHCCKHDCFPYKETQRPQLLKSLKKYKSHQFINIIMDYLPTNQHTILSSPNTPIGYEAYCNATNLLCPIWSKHFIHMHNKIKLIILGDKHIGKTSIIKRFTNNTYTEEYHDPTIDHYQKQITINHQDCNLQISDFTGEQQIYNSLNDHLLRTGQIFLCCFAINSLKSYHNALIQRQKIIRCKDNCENNWGIILVGTKCDLIEDNININSKQFVNRQTVIEQAKEYNIGYIETSAKFNVNINFLFEQSIIEYWIQSETHRCWTEEIESQTVSSIYY
eukprot:221000_1